MSRSSIPHVVQGIGMGLVAMALGQVIGWWAVVALIGFVVYREAGDVR